MTGSPPATDRALGLLLIGVAALLTLMTLMNFFALPRYAPTGNAVEVLDAEGLVIRNDNPDAIIRHDMSVNLRPGALYYRVTAVAEGFDIRPGDYGWHRGRIVLLQKSTSGKYYWHLPHVVALIQGNPVRWTYANTFRAGSSVHSLTIRAELLKATGRLRIDSIHVQPMTDAPGFRAGQQFLFHSWVGLLLAILFWVVLRLKGGRWLTVPLVVIAGTALVLSLVPAELATPAKVVAVQAIDMVSSSKATEREKTAALANNFISIAKSGHVLMFMAVGFVFALARGASSTWRIWILAVFFAALCELLQLFSPNRAPAAFDLTLNTASATVGYVVGALALNILRRYSKHGAKVLRVH